MMLGTTNIKHYPVFHSSHLALMFTNTLRVIIIISDKSLGLTATGQMGLLSHATAGGKRKALSTIIPMINGTYFHTFFAVTCKILNEERTGNVNV